jgi:hypothetical protein
LAWHKETSNSRAFRSSQHRIDIPLVAMMKELSKLIQKQST